MKVIGCLSEVIEFSIEIGVVVSSQNIEESLLSNKLVRVPTLAKLHGRNGWLRAFSNVNNVIVLVANYENDLQLKFLLQYKLSNNLNQNLRPVNNSITRLPVNFIKLMNKFRYISVIDNNTYLLNKQINHSLLLDGIYLSTYAQVVIPMYDLHTNALCGFQYIDQKGTKKFHPGSRLKNSYHIITNNNLPGKAVGLTLVGEGFATVASAVLAISTINPQLTVNGIVMFSSCNLTSFIPFIGNEDVCLLVDNDCGNQINAGVDIAMKIQKIMSHKSNFKLIIPSIHSGISCDINDYFCYYQNTYGNGYEMVNRLILSAS